MDQDMTEPAPFVAPAADFREIGTEEQVTALYAAFAEARAEFAPIVKNRVSGKGTTKEFKYADLETILDSCVPALSKHGLAVLQPPSGNAIRTMLVHKGGARIVSLMPLVDSADIKEFGGQITYLRRYVVNGLLGVSADHDADGGETKEESSAGYRGAGPQRTPQLPPQTKPASEAPPATRPTSAPAAAPSTQSASHLTNAAALAATEVPRWLNDLEKEQLSKLCQQCGDTDEAQVIARVKALTKGERPNVGHYQGLVMALKAQAAKHAQPNKET